MPTRTLLVRLPDGQTLVFGYLDTTFDQVLERCRVSLGDPEITQENIGPRKHCFFARGTTLLPENLSGTASLAALGMQFGEVIDLRYAPERV